MTLKHHLFSDNKFEQVIDPAVYNTDQTSDEIDMLGYNELTIVASLGNSADTLSGTDYIALEVQHSDVSGSGYAACADADIVNAVTAVNTGSFAKVDAPSEDTQAYKTAYKGGKRYVKVIVNFVGTHATGTPLCVNTIKGGAQAMPVNAA